MNLKPLLLFLMLILSYSLINEIVEFCLDDSTIEVVDGITPDASLDIDIESENDSFFAHAVLVFKDSFELKVNPNFSNPNGLRSLLISDITTPPPEVCTIS